MGSFEELCRLVTELTAEAFEVPSCSLHLSDDKSKPLDDISSELAAPLKYRDETIGTLDLRSPDVSSFDSDDLELLRLWATQVAAALHTTRERDHARARIIELRARSERHDLIHQIGQTFVQEETLQGAMDRVVDMVVTGLNYHRTAVLLHDAELEELEVISSHGYGEVDGLRIPVSQGATGYAVCQGEPVNIPDVTTDPRYVQGIRGGRSELAVPIICHNTIYGAIDVESPVLGAFDQEDVQLLNIVCSYASAAIIAAKRVEDLNLVQRARERLELEVKLLSTVNRALAAVQDSTTLYNGILLLVGDVLGWHDSVIWAVEPESGQLVAEQSRGETDVEVGTHVRVGEGVVGLAAGARGPIVVNAEELRSDDEDGPTVRSQMAVPLFDGRELSSVLHITGTNTALTRGDLDLLAAFGAQVSSALTAARLRNNAQKQIRALDDRTRRLDLLNRVARSLTRRLSIDELLEELLRLCAEAFELRVCAVLLLDNDKPALLRKASVGYDETAPMELAIGEGITGHVAATGVPILVTDVTKDPRYVSGVSGSRAEMAAPLRVFGEVIGVLDAESVKEGAFDEEDLDLFTCFAAQAAVAIHNADLADKLEKMGDG